MRDRAGAGCRLAGRDAWCDPRALPSPRRRWPPNPERHVRGVPGDHGAPEEDHALASNSRRTGRLPNSSRPAPGARERSGGPALATATTRRRGLRPRPRNRRPRNLAGDAAVVAVAGAVEAEMATVDRRPGTPEGTGAIR